MITKEKLDKFFSVTDFRVTTPLCESMCRHGSDKGRGIHNYTKFYNYIFSESKERELNIFEVGLGTDNTSIESNMGPGYNVGASLYGWEEYFINSKIYGADVDKNILFIRFEDFTTDPETEIKRVYNYLELPYFQHDFNNVEQLTQENDIIHGMFGDHKIQPQIKPVKDDYVEILGQEQSNRLKQHYDWYFKAFNYI